MTPNEKLLKESKVTGISCPGDDLILKACGNVWLTNRLSAMAGSLQMTCYTAVWFWDFQDLPVLAICACAVTVLFSCCRCHVLFLASSIRTVTALICRCFTCVCLYNYYVIRKTKMTARSGSWCVCITSWYPDPKLNGRHFGLPPSSIHRLIGYLGWVAILENYVIFAQCKPRCQNKRSSWEPGPLQ